MSCTTAIQGSAEELTKRDGKMITDEDDEDLSCFLFGWNSYVGCVEFAATWIRGKWTLRGTVRHKIQLSWPHYGAVKKCQI